MAAWHRFWCVTCQKEYDIGQRVYKTVYNGSTKRVKVMCAPCVAGRRDATKSAPYVEDEDTFTVPQNIVDAYTEQNSAEV